MESISDQQAGRNSRCRGERLALTLGRGRSQLRLGHLRHDVFDTLRQRRITGDRAIWLYQAPDFPHQLMYVRVTGSQLREGCAKLEQLHEVWRSHAPSARIS